MTEKLCVLFCFFQNDIALFFKLFSQDDTNDTIFFLVLRFCVFLFFLLEMLRYKCLSKIIFRMFLHGAVLNDEKMVILRKKSKKIKHTLS